MRDIGHITNGTHQILGIPYIGKIWCKFKRNDKTGFGVMNEPWIPILFILNITEIVISNGTLNLNTLVEPSKINKIFGSGVSSELWQTVVKLIESYKSDKEIENSRYYLVFKDQNCKPEKDPKTFKDYLLSQMYIFYLKNEQKIKRLFENFENDEVPDCLKGSLITT